MAVELTPDGIPVGEPDVKIADAKPTIPETAPAVSPPEQELADDITEIDFTKFLEAKQEILPKKTEVAPPAQPLAPAKPTIPRDVSDLDPDLAPVFKQMSNEAFNKLKPIVLTAKQLKTEIAAREARIQELEQGRLPESYYEHPQGYVLSPEFIQASEDFSAAQRLHEHWRKQLIEVRNGAATFKDIAFDNANNRYVLVDRDADASGESSILENLNAAQYAVSEKRTAISNLSNTYKSKQSEISNWVRSTESKMFPLFDVPERKAEFDPVIRDVISKLPPAFQRSPIASMLAKSLVTNQHLSTLLSQQLNQQTKPTNGVSAEQAKAGPTAGDTVADTSGKRSDEVTFDDFERVKAGI